MTGHGGSAVRDRFDPSLVARHSLRRGIVAAQPFDGRHDRVDARVDIGVRRRMPEAEPGRSEPHLAIDAHRGEHVGWLHRTTRAR